VPFVSYTISGERVPTVNCPTCGVQRPVAIGVCPNCMTSTAPAGARLTRGLVVAGIAIAAVMAVGYLMSRRVDDSKHTESPPVAGADTMPSPDTSMRLDSTRPVVPASIVAPVVPSRKTPAKVSAPTSTPTAARVSQAIDPAMVAPKPAQPPTVAVTDTGTWDDAVATTWVRVRSAPSRASAVLRMVDSAQHVRLGPPVSGWRPVHVGVDRGWVDPRLFTILSAVRP
jgi:hypothetical protein